MLVVIATDVKLTLTSPKLTHNHICGLEFLFSKKKQRRKVSLNYIFTLGDVSSIQPYSFNGTFIIFKAINPSLNKLFYNLAVKNDAAIKRMRSVSMCCYETIFKTFLNLEKQIMKWFNPICAYVFFK